MENLLNFVENYKMLRNLKEVYNYMNREEAVLIRGKGRILDSDEEFIKRTQDHIEKYELKIDDEGRGSLGLPLFNKKIRCVVEVVPERMLFGNQPLSEKNNRVCPITRTSNLLTLVTIGKSFTTLPKTRQ